MNNSPHPAPKGVDQDKVIEALKELLEGPLISGFVSQDQVSIRIYTAKNAAQASCKLAILPACRNLPFADLLHVVETTWNKPVEKTFSQSTCNRLETTRTP